MTRTQLANIALSLLGARRLVDIDADTTVEARSAFLHFDLTFRALLRRHQWNFAQRRHRVPDPTPHAASATLAPGILATAKAQGTAGNSLTAAIAIVADSTALSVAQTDGALLLTGGGKRRMIYNGFALLNFNSTSWTTDGTGTPAPEGEWVTLYTPGANAWLARRFVDGVLVEETYLGESPVWPDVEIAAVTAAPATAGQAIAAADAVTALPVAFTLLAATDPAALLVADGPITLAGGRNDLASTANEYAYAYPLPADFVRLIRLATTDVHNPVRAFSIEGNFLLTDSPAFELVYISANCLDDLDDLFIEAFTLSLASKLAGDVLADANLKASFLQQLEQLHLPAAQSADAKEVLSGENFGPRALASMSGLVQARFRGDGRPPYVPTLP